MTTSDTPGMLQVPARTIPVPKSVSPEAQATLAMGRLGPPPREYPALDDVAGWKELVEDTTLNEGTRRRQIHEMLAKTGLVRPEKVLKPIYKDVLHADLDDPYLGLGKTLFATYPFAREDQGH